MTDNYLKKTLKKSFVVRKTYGIVMNEFHKRRREKGRIVFERNGVSVIHSTQKIFSCFEEKVDFFFAYGTLLGIIRDGKLLGRDMDIDTLVLLENEKILSFRRYLESKGYERLYSYYIDGVGITQDAYIFEGVMVDVNYVYPNQNGFLNYIFYDTENEKNKVLAFPFSSVDTKCIRFENYFINIPQNPELYLEETYGEDWRIPNPQYKYWENENAINTNLIGEFEKIKNFQYS